MNEKAIAITDERFNGFSIFWKDDTNGKYISLGWRWLPDSKGNDEIGAFLEIVTMSDELKQLKVENALLRFRVDELYEALMDAIAYAQESDTDE